MGNDSILRKTIDLWLQHAEGYKTVAGIIEFDIINKFYNPIMNKIIKYHLAIIILIVVTISIGCQKEKKATIPILITSTVSNINATTASSGGSITNDGGATVTSRGVCWSSGIEPSLTDNKTSDGAGAGNFTSTITGLNGGTTYYIRAYATNGIGTGYGMAMSFITLGQSPVPAITTPTNVNTTSATLNGTVKANYLSTVVTIEYGTTSSYGSTVTPSQNPVTGNTSTTVSADITGLTAGTVYHFRLKAVNSLGTTYSNDLTFTTLGQAPDATTQAATNTAGISTTLNGSVNAHYLSTVVTFEYGTSTSYGSTITASQSPLTGNSTASVSANLSGLTPNTIYHFRVKTVNSVGTIYGSDLTFTTLGQSPTATTQAATNITTTSTTVNGVVNANFLSTTVTFEYGTTITYDNSVSANQSPVTGNSTTSVIANILGLSPNTIYHYRVKATNVLGTTYGSDMTFTTLGQPPTATTQAATNIQPFSSTLNGTINPNYLSTTITFEYGTNTSYGTTATATQSPVTGSTNTNINAPISGLTEGTVYHFRIKAVNSLGLSYGSDMTFTTLGQPPTVTVLAATNKTSVSAQLNGTVNGNYLSTVVTFEYGTTISYGSTISATQSPVAGSTNTIVNANITGLSDATLYHYRIKAVNSLGTTYSDDITFVYLHYGVTYQGGLVFYIDGTGQHGLVCAPTDQSTGAPWGNPTAAITTGYNVGTGNQNTINIVTNCSTVGIAARICYDLDLNGYTDWFLPSMGEINLMYTNLKLNSFGGFALANYWSSTMPVGEPYIFNFVTNTQSYADKSYTFYVRAVRAF